MHRGDKDTEAQRDGETYLVIGSGQDLSGFSRSITNTNWVLTRSQVYCPKCLLFTRNHAPIIIPFFFSGTFSIMWWHQITKCVYCLLTKCQPLYINSPLKSSQQVWMYYLYWWENGGPETPSPKTHNQHQQNQAGRSQSYHLTSELCLQPRNRKIKIILLSLKARCFSISWWPVADQASTCLILPGK